MYYYRPGRSINESSTPLLLLLIVITWPFNRRIVFVWQTVIRRPVIMSSRSKEDEVRIPDMIFDNKTNKKYQRGNFLGKVMLSVETQCLLGKRAQLSCFHLNVNSASRVAKHNDDIFGCFALKTNLFIIKKAYWFLPSACY